MKELDEAFAKRWSRNGLFFLGLAILSLVFLSLWQRNQMIHIGYEIERLHQEKADLGRIHKELMVEVESLTSLERIEQIATRQLKMVPALPQQQIPVYIQSAIEPSPPAVRFHSEPAEKIITAGKGG